MAGVVKAKYDPRIAWSSQVFGMFQLDRSTIGGADVLAASSWSQTFQGQYDSLLANSLRTDDFEVTRGRADDLSSVQAGVAGLTVIDPTGILNPKNSASPLYGLTVAGQTAVRPNRPGRITMTYGGIVYPVYYGFVRTVEYDPGIRIGLAKIEMDDLFGWLDTPRDQEDGGAPLPIIARMNNTTTGAAIKAILASIGWTDESMMLLDAGDSIPYFEAVGDQTPLQLIADLVQANGGIFYIDAIGRAVFEDRNTKWFRTSYATIANTMQAVTPGTSRDAIVNTWNMTRMYETVPGDPSTLTASIVQQATDAASRTEFGVRAQDFSSKYFPSDTFALNAGQWRLMRTKDPLSPIWSMGIDNRDNTQMLALAQAELNKRMTVQALSGGGTSGDYFIEQIHHAVSRHDGSHKCNLVLSERIPSMAPFVVGTDTVGGVAGLGF